MNFGGDSFPMMCWKAVIQEIESWKVSPPLLAEAPDPVFLERAVGSCRVLQEFGLLPPDYVSCNERGEIELGKRWSGSSRIGTILIRTDNTFATVE
jgi:hypothetical protein